MKKCLTILSMLLLCAGACMAQDANAVDKVLQNSMNKSDAGLIEVNIVMKSQVEPARVKALAASARSGAARRNVILRELKAHAGRSQRSVLAILDKAVQCGAAADVVTHWMSNTISCSATKEVIQELASHPDVLSIGQDVEVQVLSCREADVSSQEYAAQKSHSATPHVLQVNADDVWQQGYTGKNVIVAILDSGTNPDHYDLKDHLWKGYADADGDGEKDDCINGWNFIGNNSNIADDFGHGTHCAGIVCGDGTVGNITGVAPDATLMTVKIVNRNGGGKPSQMLSGVEFAVENGADILSMSLGFKKSQISESDIVALRRTFESTLSLGVVVCAAAGNDGNSYGAPLNVDFPAACPPPYLHPDQQVNAGGLTSVICVGSVDSYDRYVSTSSQGPSTWQDTEFGDYPYGEGHIGLIRPDICAPGELVYSLKHDENDKYKYMSGTSQATPCVAGVIALMLEKNPGLTPAQVCEAIEATAKKLSASKDNNTGSGRIDALAAVNSISATGELPFIRLGGYTPAAMAAGEGKEIGFVITNAGKGAGNDVVSYLSTGDPYITVTDGVVQFGSLGAGESAEGVFTIATAAEMPDGHTVRMTVTTCDGECSWSDDIEILFDSYARIVCSSVATSVLSSGKGVKVNVNIVNQGTVATIGETRIVLKSSSPYVTVVKDEAVLGVMAVGEEKSVEFVIDVDGSAPDNCQASFDVYATPDNYTVSRNILYEFEPGRNEDGHVKDGLDSWTTFDASNDGRNHPWWHSSSAGVHRVESIGEARSGKGQVMSEAYCQASMMEYDIPVDNYLVSPRVRIASGSSFSFWARVHSAGWYGEHFGVAVSEAGNSSAKDFTTLQQWTITKDDGAGWRQYTVDLSAYEGKEVYVAIRHFFTEEQWSELNNGWDVYMLHVDDAMFHNVVDVSDAFVYDNYSYFTMVIEGNPLAAPDNVEAVAVNEHSIHVSWSTVANAQSYNIYRDGVCLANIGALEYTDGGLDSDTEYGYSVAAVYNGKEYERSHEVYATTDKADYSLKIKEISVNGLDKGENVFSVVIVNNGRYEQKSRSRLTLSTGDSCVAITSGSASMKYLTVGEEYTAKFAVTVDSTVPGGHIVEFVLNVSELYEDKNSWDLRFRLPVNNPDVPAGIVDVETDAATDGAVYDLNGRRVVNPGKGIYIVGRKKVLVR